MDTWLASSWKEVGGNESIRGGHERGTGRLLRGDLCLGRGTSSVDVQTGRARFRAALVMLRADGSLDFIGRMDYQVKMAREPGLRI